MTGLDEVDRLAAESLAAADPTGWFERVYAAAEDGVAVVPWDRGGPHPVLVEWARAGGLGGSGRRALVVGCGFGADAEYVAELGFDTIAFDISATAIRTARRRFPESDVRYLTADLLDPPGDWRGAFDLVVESLTVQSLPDPPRAEAIARIGEMVGTGGTLIVIASARDGKDAATQGPPWPLTRGEIEAFATGGLEPVRIERVRGAARQAPRRWRAELRRP